MKFISSVQNTYIKSLLQLQDKAKARKQSGTFLIEGLRELELAQQAKYTFEKILFCPDVLSKSFSISQFDAEICIEITKEVYQKLAYRDTTEGILAVAYSKSHQLSELKLPKNPLILVMESIEKPGNIGAILRTCDAAHVDAVILADSRTDLYNPNVIRSSVGCLFTNQIAIASSEETISFLGKNNIQFYAATLQNSNVYSSQDYTPSTALVVGTEATGLSEIWRSKATKNVIIPMQGAIDSMNVSVAAAILLFEAKRQRGFQY